MNFSPNNPSSTLNKTVFLVGFFCSIGNSVASEIDGAFVQLGAGGSHSYTQLSSTRNGILDGTSAQGNANGLMAAGYSTPIGQTGFNLAGNLFYIIGNQNTGVASNTVTRGNVSTQGSNSGTFSNSFGLSLEPGWLVTKQTLGYAKLAWVNTSAEYRTSATLTTGRGSVTDSATSQKNMNGFGYGLGVKQFLSRSMYVGIDVLGVAYGSTKTPRGASIRAEQVLGFISAGYQF